MPLDNTSTGENHIPEAIRRQSQRADDIAREVGIANVPAADDAGGDPVPGVADPPAPVSTTVVTPPVVAPADDWEQKYRTLQGKYDSEVPVLRAQINGMERLLANIDQRSRQDPPPATPAPAPVNPTVVVPTEDVDAFGDELITASRRWAQAELMPHITRLENTIKDLQTKNTQVEQTVQRTEETNLRGRVMSTLDADPDVGTRWREINNDPAFFNGWCLEADAFSGEQRLKLLRSAFDSGNAARCKAFITAYIAEHTVPTVPAADAPTPPAKGAGAPRLEDFAAPGRSSGQAPAGAQADKRVWSNADIAAFYRDVQKGAFKGREAEKLRLETDIIAAATEGRVR